VSPILVRPVREQLEHDRLIRFLLTKYKRKFDVAANIGDEQTLPVKIGLGTFFPDLVLNAGKRLAGVVEVESAESVNNLEALAQWVNFSRARVPFHLYVPVQAVDAARRLCAANSVSVSEIWTYRAAIDGFDLMRVFHGPTPAGRTHQAAPAPVVRAPKPPPAAAPRSPKPVPAAKAPAPSAAAKPTKASRKPSKASAKPPAKSAAKSAAPQRKPARAKPPKPKSGKR
jgi:hypothetical protein